MTSCADCQGQGRVDVGGFANFGNGLEPYEQLQDCEYCDGTGLTEGDDEYELIEEMIKRYLSEAADAERNGNFKEANQLNKLAQIQASTNSFLQHEKWIKFQKTLGPTLKTKKRIK